MENNATNATQPEAPRRRCLNCGKKLAKKGAFCPHCAQRDFDGRIKLRDFFGKFLLHLTHLDNKFIRMSWQLLEPGKVTEAYFQGKIRRYPHPLQFFFIVMFFFLLFFGKSCKGTGISFDPGHGGLNINDSKEKVDVWALIQDYALAIELQNAYQSMPASWHTPESKLAIDSVTTIVTGKWDDKLTQIDSLGVEGRFDSIPFTMFNHQVKISIVDLVKLTPDSIFSKYSISKWQEQLLLRQGIKTLHDPVGLINRYVGSAAWTILVLIALMAGVLSLFYWRRNRYYVEHLIFLLHQHAGAFLMLTLLLLVDVFIYPVHPVIFILAVFWIGISLLMAMKRYYGQSWLKTTFKWMIYCLLYLMGFVTLFAFSILVIFAIF
ncbi:MAG: DUF3667 domain-containing protein [Saprospiraceae bacterium]|nr:DUF3667 domain-containing protein [Saprospiraceae bacterium]